ncbi:MAG: hypothetical protein LUC33_00250 [Prevotellaceae bacterium]|nr:hypothetical protein [Prevotellaceae bacterium]
MAGKSTISITFRLDGDTGGFKALAGDADGLKKAVTGAVKQAEQLKASTVNFAALATSVRAAADAFSGLAGMVKDLSAAYAVQEAAETKLATVMTNRMKATDSEIQSIKDLAAAQQSLGVIGDEVQLSGAQQMATFLCTTDSIKTLLPAMNDLIAQQDGLNATTGDAETIAKAMGKAMEGSTTSLERMGITFTDAQKSVMQYGDESERAAMLCSVIEQNVGGMNAQLAQTDSGRQAQLANQLSDIKEKVGGLVSGAAPFVTLAAQSGQAFTSITTLTKGFKALGAAFKANPIGIVVTAIAALVTAVVEAYRHCEGFRNAVNNLWQAVKPLAEALMNTLGKALEFIIDKLKIAVDWFKKLIGWQDKVPADTGEAPAASSGSTDTSALEEKYAGYRPAATSSTGTGPTWTDDAKTLREVTDNISILQKQLESCTAENAGAINDQIAHWQEMKKAIESATDEVQENADAVEDEVESTGPKLDEQATTLAGITENIKYWQAALQDATAENAADINAQIEAWQEMADAIRNAGKETDDLTARTAKADKSFSSLWSSTKGITSSISDLTETLSGEGTVWEKITALIDTFLSVFQGVQQVVSIIQAMTEASKAHAAAKTQETTVTATNATITAASAVSNAASSELEGDAAETDATQQMTDAAAKIANAHAAIPFVGIALAAASIAAMIATLVSLPKLASGGIATGPTLAMVGEYSGATSNPEVIAPLDRLQDMMDNSNGNGGEVEFRIKGSNLVGVLNRRNSRTNRS